MHTFSAEVKRVDALPSGFSSHAVNLCSSCGLFSARFFSFLCLLKISLLKTTSTCRAEVPSSVPDGKKAKICLMEKKLR